jgi:hypothetical protein
MKKKIRIPIIPIILVIIAIIIIVVVINKNSKTSEEQLLQGEYDKLNSMQSYQFTKEKDSKNKTIVAKDGDKTAIDSYADGQHTTTVIKDNKTYYILHDKEEYYIYNSTNIENSIVIDWIKDVIGKEHTNGEEKVRGRKLKYEEYTGSTMFSETTSLDIDESKTKTRFYFDKNKDLVYIKTIYENGTEELQKIEITQETNSKLFEIPATYAEN